MLKYSKNHTFRIMQLSDTHFGDLPFNEEDKKTVSGIEKAIKELKPNLIIHTGDIIGAKDIVDPHHVFEEIVKKLNNFGVPVAYTFGNHDSDKRINRKELREIVKKHHTEELFDYQHIQSTDKDRLNYCINIYTSNGIQVKNNIFVLDSGEYSNRDYSKYHWISDDQIKWFREVNRNYVNQQSFIFQHIPLHEYREAAERMVDGMSLIEKKEFAIPSINSGFFATFLEYENIWGMFCGHDHFNNFHGMYCDKHLVYGNVGGYNTHGISPRGVRIVDLNETNNEVNTYIIGF